MSSSSGDFAATAGALAAFLYKSPATRAVMANGVRTVLAAGGVSLTPVLSNPYVLATAAAIGGVGYIAVKTGAWDSVVQTYNEYFPSIPPAINDNAARSGAPKFTMKPHPASFIRSADIVPFMDIDPNTGRQNVIWTVKTEYNIKDWLRGEGQRDIADLVQILYKKEVQPSAPKGKQGELIKPIPKFKDSAVSGMPPDMEPDDDDNDKNFKIKLRNGYNKTKEEREEILKYVVKKLADKTHGKISKAEIKKLEVDITKFYKGDRTIGDAQSTPTEGHDTSIEAITEAIKQRTDKNVIVIARNQGAEKILGVDLPSNVRPDIIAVYSEDVVELYEIVSGGQEVDQQATKLKKLIEQMEPQFKARGKEIGFEVESMRPDEAFKRLSKGVEEFFKKK